MVVILHCRQIRRFNILPVCTKLSEGNTCFYSKSNPNLSFDMKQIYNLSLVLTQNYYGFNR